MTTDSGASAPRVVVEVDVFSGVPNPKWTLDADSAARLTTLVSQLTPVADRATPVHPGLGFRGFVVRGVTGHALGSVGGSPGDDATLRVRGQDVVVTAGDRPALFADHGHEIYTMLRDLSLDHVPSDIASHIPAGGLEP